LYVCRSWGECRWKTRPRVIFDELIVIEDSGGSLSITWSGIHHLRVATDAFNLCGFATALLYEKCTAQHFSGLCCINSVGRSSSFARFTSGSDIEDVVQLVYEAHLVVDMRLTREAMSSADHPHHLEPLHP
jgi:hypothetical protein